MLPGTLLFTSTLSRCAPAAGNGRWRRIQRPGKAESPPESKRQRGFMRSELSLVCFFKWLLYELPRIPFDGQGLALSGLEPALLFWR